MQELVLGSQPLSQNPFIVLEPDMPRDLQTEVSAACLGEEAGRRDATQLRQSAAVHATCCLYHRGEIQQLSTLRMDLDPAMPKCSIY